MAQSENVQAAAAWLKSVKIGFLGCGNMAQAMINGFIKSNLVPAENIVVSATCTTSKNYLACQKLDVQCTTNNEDVCRAAKIVFVAVKPHLVRPVLSKCSFPKDTLLISVAAGVKLSVLGETSRVQQLVRAMPNTGACVQQGVTVYAYDEAAIASVRQAAIAMLMESLGFARYVPESQIEPISAVSGSGIAYMYMALEAMADGAVKAGIQRSLAYDLASHTMMGAAAMVKETGQHPGALKDAVCSPGGSTIAGVHALEKSGFRAAMMDAVEAAFTRVKQLG
ncbi:uncharacterized protein LOC135828345 [Sycon ciliatum]|uniref:uncharacterized protein LOC135828345 n=1 Tax=Sycon ciliatum TaxID=27933 RepID=UPI0031F6B0DC